MQYETIIGLEVHVQLQTNSKLFCGCVNKFNPDNPNTQTCPVCLGLPGTLPVMNRRAFDLSIRTALALNCQIANFTKWDRKQYFYPDSPTAYQISQYDLPFSYSGWLNVDIDENTQTKVGIIRAHLEEDAGKNMHDETGSGKGSRVDLNRVGTPLLEIVSEPDIRSAVEARRYLEELRLLLTFIGVSDCNMQEGSLRCDANVNLHVAQPDGEPIPTPIVEIKNMNSFSNVEAAISSEIERQWSQWQKTGAKLGDVPKQTRGWDADRGVTFAQRGKEEAADYRYFPDPDLVPVTVTAAEIETFRSELGELPAAKRDRYQTSVGLSAYDAKVIVERGPAFANYFDGVFATCSDGKLAANWTTQEVLRELNERSIDADEFPVPAETLGTVLLRIQEKKITTSSARTVFSELLKLDQPTASNVDQLIADLGLEVISDTGQLDSIIASVIEANPGPAADVRAGKQQAVGPLIGQVMKQLAGADAKTVREMIIQALSS
ncbi:MAG: Asp-tRNA(Asn)/Glu-tRNA(Gln) amidotransferase subunit GatB [Planctomycetaceae bacterium]